MKKLLLLALVSTVGVYTLGACETHEHIREHIKELVHFAQEIKGKTVTIPAKLCKEMHNFKANALRRHAAHFRHMAESVENGAPYYEIASELENVAGHIQALPAVDHKKTFSYPGLMLPDLAEQAEHEGKNIELIGKELGNERIMKLGEKKKFFGKELERELAKAACEVVENRNHEGHEEAVGNEGHEEWIENEGHDVDMEEGGDVYGDEGEETMVVAQEDDNSDVDEEDNDSNQE